MAAFLEIYDEITDEQKTLTLAITVGGQELRQRLVSSGKFITSDAQMMIEEMVRRG